jgi:hypothetical protein
VEDQRPLDAWAKERTGFAQLEQLPRNHSALFKDLAGLGGFPSSVARTGLRPPQHHFYKFTTSSISIF